MQWWNTGASSAERLPCFMTLLEEWWNVYQRVRSKQAGGVERGGVGGEGSDVWEGWLTPT